MRMLKVWGFILLIAAIVLYLIGVFGGEFSEYGLYGKSTEAIILLFSSIFCFIVSISVLLTVHAIHSIRKNNRQ